MTITSRTAPAGTAAASPSAPPSSSSTWAVVRSIATTTSVSSATARADVAGTMPAAAAAATRPAAISKPTTTMPARRRFAAIGSPISPRPIHPTVLWPVDSGFIGGRALRAGREPLRRPVAHHVRVGDAGAERLVGGREVRVDGDRHSLEEHGAVTRGHDRQVMVDPDAVAVPDAGAQVVPLDDRIDRGGDLARRPAGAERLLRGRGRRRVSPRRARPSRRRAHRSRPGLHARPSSPSARSARRTR